MLYISLPSTIMNLQDHGSSKYGLAQYQAIWELRMSYARDMGIEENMEKKWNIFHCIYNVGLHSVRFLTLLLTGALTLCSLLWGYYAEDMTTQKSVAHWEPVLLHLAGLAVLLICLFGLMKICHPTAGRRRFLLLCAAMAWIGLWGLFLIFCGRNIPAADSASVYSIAQALASGHTQVIHPTDSYLSYYPQQMGLVAFYEIIIRLWNLLPIPYAAHYIIQCVNVAMACGAVFFQYKITCLLSRDSDRAAAVYLFLAMLNAPLLFYTSFVYGEIPSFAFLSGGLYLLLNYLQKEKFSSRHGFLSLTGSLLMLVSGVALRKNSLIVMIAAVLVVLWEWTRQRGASLPVFAALLAAGCLTVQPAIQRFYEYRAGNVLSTGVPAISYVAMGMQESDRGNGWYNGFNFDTYEESHLDTAVTAQKSKNAISQSLSAFRASPGFAFRFYRDKFLSQWTDGSYFCRQATAAHTDGRRDFVEEVYTGALAAPFIHYCNIYQLLIYGGSFTCMLVLFRRRAQDPTVGLSFYMGMIAVLGGFLFHMVWEANSRYIFPYFLLLLPYAALGLEMIPALFSKSKKDRFLFSV